MSFRVYFTTKSQPNFWEKKDFRTSPARDEWLDKEDANLDKVEIERHQEPEKKERE